MKAKLQSQLTDAADIIPFLGGGGTFLAGADAQTSMLVFLCLFLLLHIPRLERQLTRIEKIASKVAAGSPAPKADSSDK